MSNHTSNKVRDDFPNNEVRDGFREIPKLSAAGDYE